MSIQENEQTEGDVLSVKLVCIGPCLKHVVNWHSVKVCLGFTGVAGDASEGNAEAEGTDDRMYCYCKLQTDEIMIACDSGRCDIEWFHYSCVYIDHPPEGKWFCNECAARDGFVVD